MHWTCCERFACQEGMVVALDSNEYVAPRIFHGHVPRLFGMTTPTTDLQTASLAKRVEREALMRSKTLSISGLDRAWSLVEELLEELPKRTLADEADSGAIRLVEHWQTCATCAVANFRFLQLA